MGLSAETKLSLATSNYLSSDRSLETLNMIRLSCKPVKGGTLSLDTGFDTTFKPNENGLFGTTMLPAFEAKYKQKLGNYFRGYVRYRNINMDTNQLRVSAGGSIPLTDHLSLYADGHYTTKFGNGNDKIGAWTGLDYCINPNLSVWSEYQINGNVDKENKKVFEAPSSVNIGITYTF